MKRKRSCWPAPFLEPTGGSTGPEFPGAPFHFPCPFQAFLPFLVSGALLQPSLVPSHARCCRALRLGYRWQCDLKQETSGPRCLSFNIARHFSSPLKSQQPPVPLNSTAGPRVPWGTQTGSLLVPGWGSSQESFQQLRQHRPDLFYSSSTARPAVKQPRSSKPFR